LKERHDPRVIDIIDAYHLCVLLLIEQQKRSPTCDALVLLTDEKLDANPRAAELAAQLEAAESCGMY
jgi:hypothetical protein